MNTRYNKGSTEITGCGVPYEDIDICTVCNEQHHVDTLLELEDGYLICEPCSLKGDL